jgi:hypothetical protein
LALAPRDIITVCFSLGKLRIVQEYKPITGLGIDGDHALLDNQPVQLEVTHFSDSSHDPSLYPSGTTQRDYVASAAAIACGSSRTSLSVVMELDSMAFKIF